MEFYREERVQRGWKPGGEKGHVVDDVNAREKSVKTATKEKYMNLTQEKNNLVLGGCYRRIMGSDNPDQKGFLLSFIPHLFHSLSVY